MSDVSKYVNVSKLVSHNKAKTKLKRHIRIIKQELRYLTIIPYTIYSLKISYVYDMFEVQLH